MKIPPLCTSRMNSKGGVVGKSLMGTHLGALQRLNHSTNLHVSLIKAMKIHRLPYHTRQDTAPTYTCQNSGRKSMRHSNGGKGLGRSTQHNNNAL